MDNDRNIRFLIPPIFFLFLIFWALITEPCQNHLNSLFGYTGTFSNMDGLSKIIGLIIGGSASIIAIGFIISSFTIFIINFLKLFGFYIESVVSKNAYLQLRTLLFTNEKKRVLKDFDFYIFNDTEKHENNVKDNTYKKKRRISENVFMLLVYLNIG